MAASVSLLWCFILALTMPDAGFASKSLEWNGRAWARPDLNFTPRQSPRIFPFRCDDNVTSQGHLLVFRAGPVIKVTSPSSPFAFSNPEVDGWSVVKPIACGGRV